MRKYSRVLFFIFSFVLLGFTAFQSYAESIEGNWKIKTEYTVILIKECEKQSWCADIVGFFGPVNSDMNDEEVAKLCDARILEGLEKKDKKYQNGTFYDVLSNDKYNLSGGFDEEVFKIRVYKGVTWLGETLELERTEEIEFPCSVDASN